MILNISELISILTEVKKTNGDLDVYFGSEGLDSQCVTNACSINICVHDGENIVTIIGEGGND